MANDPITATEFLRAVISALILDGERGIQPKNAADRRGFACIVSTLDDAAKELRAAEAQRVWYRAVVRLRNLFQASNNGSFDSIETLLRELQTSALMLPNPDYDDMTFQLSVPYARSVLESLEESERKLVQRAAEAFRKGKQTTSVREQVQGMN